MPIDIEKDDIQTALKKLKARENAWRQLEKITQLGSWEVDLKTQKSTWSKRSYEIYKVPQDEKIGLHTFFEMLLPEYHEAAHKTMQEGIKTAKPISFTGKSRRRDGKIIHILLNAQVILDENNHPDKIIGTTQDITKYTELQEHAKELSDLLEHSSNEIYIIHRETLQYLYVNKGACSALGYTPQELLQMNVRDINPYLKEDEIQRLKALSKITNHVLNRTVHQRKNGSMYHVQSFIHTLNYQGQSAYVIFDTDISQTIELELEYKKQAKVLEHIHDSVISTDIYGTITSWNQGSTKLFGYSADEMIGKKIQILYSKNNENSIETLFSHINTVKGKIDEEVLMIKKDAQEIICDMSLSVLRDNFGAVEGYIGYIQDITEQKRTQQLLEEQTKKLRYQAHHDLLTALPNRTLFKERLSQAVIHSKRNKEKFALLFIDLDQFKKINDSLGHHIGDEVLIEAANRLQNTIREQDTLSRLGGDEFTIILKNIKTPQNAAKVAKKINDILNKPIFIGIHTLYISSSIGISIYPDDTTLENDLIKYADTAMYKAKDEGRNNYQFYSAEMTQQALERVLIENNLRSAIKEEEFIVYFQPQYNAKENKIIGMEALVRWLHPKEGLIQPYKFIPIAEDTGLIIDIDNIVMKKAMQQFVLWYNQGLNPGKLSLNLSMKQLNQDDFIPKLEQLIKETQFNSQWLELEVTEGEVMNNPDASIEKLLNINTLGIDIAIDDFGTGYSSLSYLKKLPLDKLKIDQSFIRDLPDDEEDIAITKAIIALGKSLNLKLIAEGVETQEQKNFLLQNGCHYVQGYYYSKPIPANEMTKLLELALT